MRQKDLLVEIGCEELPAKLLPALAISLHTNIIADLTSAQISFGATQWFATPRRLAVLIRDLALQQPAQKIERRGPTLAVAYDADGKPSLALQGFLKAVNIKEDQLIKEETPKGTWLLYRDTIVGKKTVDLLPTIINSACKKLPIPKLMRWGNHPEQFIRPVRWIVLLFGNTVIPTTILGKKTGRLTYGHRFMAPQAIILKKASDYENLLVSQGKVIADFARRKNIITQQIKKLAATKHAQVKIDENLLIEVCGLVEWPVALLANFDTDFLSVPPEALIATMQVHQKCFALVDKTNKLVPHFITISNIKSRSPQHVINGNEKVMRARLSDASFFYTEDLKHPLTYYLAKLKTIVFQQGLGTLFDKSQRVAELAKFIFEQISADNTHKIDANLSSDAAYTAGLLCKADLATNMVGEFPELQGIMGYYYIKADSSINNKQTVAQAIADHYKPRFSSENVTITAVSAAVALADKIDTLVSSFGINQKPTGEKDPFGLRRTALGIIKISLENNYDFDLQETLTKTANIFTDRLKNSQVVTEVLTFIFERLRFYLANTGLFNAVFARQKNKLYDFQLRVAAVEKFLALPAAANLIAANKRVGNILIKAASFDNLQLKENLLQEQAEQALWQQMKKLTPQITVFCNDKNYTAALKSLAKLKIPIDAFFDQVMVISEDSSLRNNRLALLKNLRELFLKIADISLLT